MIRVFHASLVALTLCSLNSAQKSQPTKLNTFPSGQSSATQPAMAASGSWVYVVWLEARPSGPEVFFNRSADGGNTWLPHDIRISTATAVDECRVPRIAAAGEQVYVVWQGERPGSSSDIRFNRSLDGGTTWLPDDIRLDTDPPTNAISHGPEIEASGGNVYVVWRDLRNTDLDIYLNRSTDGGTTWLTSDVRVNAVGGATSSWPSLAAVGSNVYVTWIETLFGDNEILFNRSTDGGLTWLPNDVRVNSTTSTTPSRPQVAAAGQAVYVTWEAQGTNANEIYFNRSLDQGTTWLPTQSNINGGSGFLNSDNPRIAAAESNVYVVWDNGSPSRESVFFNRSLDHGTTWLPQPTVLDLAVGPTSLSLVAEGSAVYVGWTAFSLLYNRSLDGGTTWLANPINLNSGFTGVNGSLAIADGSLHAVWEARSTPRADVYATFAFGHQHYGSGTPGFGGFVPDLDVSGRTTIGDTITLTISNARAGIPGALLLGPRASFPAFGGAILVNPLTLIPLSFGGGAPVGTPGAGVADYDLAIPADPAFVGGTISVQGVAIDPGAAQGVALTAGVELWIG